MRPRIAVLLAFVTLPAAAFEVKVDAVLAPFNRPIDVTSWAEFRLIGSEPEIHRLFPLSSGDRVLTRFTVVPGVEGARRSLEGRLEAVLFPATVYVGRSCPPQDHAELYEVVPGRGDRKRRPLPVAEATTRGRWRAFPVTTGAGVLTARYFCFPAAHQMGEGDLPPEPGEEPPAVAAARPPGVTP